MRMIQEVNVTLKQLQVSLSGSLHTEEAKAIQDSLAGYIDRGHITILIDLAKVDHIDYFGLDALVFIHKRALAKGGSLELKGLQGDMKTLFEVTQLNKMFMII